MRGKELLASLKEKFQEHNVSYRFPYVFIQCVSDKFDDRDEDNRLKIACKTLKMSVDEFDRIAASCLFMVSWLTPEEYAEDSSYLPDTKNCGTNLLKAFVCEHSETPEQMERNPFKTVHFYGYKGGQARTTVLACIGRELAEKGYRVLLVDADIEAPSIHEVFSIATRTTLLDLLYGNADVVPTPSGVVFQHGCLDILPCRSSTNGDDDIEYAAFLIHANISSDTIDNITSRIDSFAREKNYDVVLIDHRSGFSVPTLAWMENLAGPAVLFVKLDKQWKIASSGMQEILRCNISNPGMIVTYKPDDEIDNSFLSRTQEQKEDLLDMLSRVFSLGTEDGEELSSEDVADRWIVWPYDKAFRENLLPAWDELSKNNQRSIRSIIDILDFRQRLPLNHSEEKVPSRKNNQQSSSLSGADDDGVLIQTEMLQKLTAPDNPYSYIFGRKGAGKSRVLRELSHLGLGEPLIVDPHFKGKGIQADSPAFEMAHSFFGNHESSETSSQIDLWWAILLAALKEKTVDRDCLEKQLRQIVETHKKSKTNLYLEVVKHIRASEHRVFLIDGIELAFSSDVMPKQVESLFRFLNIVQTDERINDRVRIKLFLRQDLLSITTIQNVEQQLHGRKLELSWDYERILNFMLSRIILFEFYKNHFKSAVKEIEKNIQRIEKGGMPKNECENILKKIFPDKLKRFNISLTAFLRLHFSDHPDENGSYYPRVFLAFLESISDSEKGSKKIPLVDKRIDQRLVIQSHEAAAEQYLEESKQELKNLLNFGEKVGSIPNDEILNEWLQWFREKTTPFVLTKTAKEISQDLGLSIDVVRECLNRMKTIGVFEDRPGYKGQWRVGRLFKSALKMKFNRL